jgi:hypothetical protein
VFAPISAIFSLLFFASTLPNGIRLVELPAEGENVEIVAGYTVGGLTGFASTPSFRSLLQDAYAVGTDVTFIAEPDRTALRITVPKWALSMVTDRLPALFRVEGDVGAVPASPSSVPMISEEKSKRKFDSLY